MSAGGGYSLILVVEPDEASLAEMLKALRSAGYHTTGATTFEEARRQLALDPPRVVVAAARLGAFSGLHLAIIARELRPDCQSLILADAADAVLEREVTDAGAVFTLKPLGPGMLPASIESLFGTPPCSDSSPAELAANMETLALENVERRLGERRRTVTADFTPERRTAERRRPPTEGQSTPEG